VPDCIVTLALMRRSPYVPGASVVAVLMTVSFAFWSHAKTGNAGMVAMIGAVNVVGPELRSTGGDPPLRSFA
jgi:hypothetical protein